MSSLSTSTRPWTIVLSRIRVSWYWVLGLGSRVLVFAGATFKRLKSFNRFAPFKTIPDILNVLNILNDLNVLNPGRFAGPRSTVSGRRS
jgi:hypothetical protein